MKPAKPRQRPAKGARAFTDLDASATQQKRPERLRMGVSHRVFKRRKP